MSYRDWHVGMKVVCVDDQWRGAGYQSSRGIPCPLVAGKIYQIEAIGVVDGVYWGAQRATIGVMLVGVRKEKTLPGDALNRHGFSAARFRPVQTRKTDISIFTAMLDKPKVPILAGTEERG